ncbi:MAG: hypothetical protein HOP28_02040 [Gemmatimonadales bacterium]|nr:hypothetical protein [Gemmatimonadales bacterium]
MSSMRWVASAALLGFGASSVLASILHLPRDLFVAFYAAGVTAFVVALFRVEQIDPWVQLRRRWLGGVVGGALVGALLTRTVLAQPASAPPAGGALAWALLWNGGAYGFADGLLLNVLPVLLVYGRRPAGELRHAGHRWRWALISLGASLFVTAAYHLGFAEFRGGALLAPIIGNTIITAGYLLTGSPVAALLSHMVMHGAAVIHGMDTTVQWTRARVGVTLQPPHPYPSPRCRSNGMQQHSRSFHGFSKSTA